MSLKRLLTLSCFCFLFLFVSIARAETLELPKLNLPKTQAGVVYSAKEKEFKGCATLTLLSYPTKIGEFELRGGYILDKEPMAALCFKVGDLTQYGFQMPLHHLINISIGGYAGYMIDEDIEKDKDKLDYGLIATIIEVKF